MLFQQGEDTYGWNSTNYTTIDDPGRERGDMAGHAVDGGAGSGNYQFAAPLLGLEGRGLDLNMAFNYNSRLWHKSGNEMYFDPDRDWIPGWSLGFGKIVMAGTSYILIDGDGTRHPYSGKYRGDFGGDHQSLQTYEAYTTDGSFINYYAEGYEAQHDNSGGRNMVRAWAKLPNGTTIEYSAAANYAMYPKRITDANGNFISINYRWYLRDSGWKEEGPDIDSITDTLGRFIQFHYDSDDRLTAVTAPGFNAGDRRVLVRLSYGTRYLSDAGNNYGFSLGLVPKVRSVGIPVIKAIYYPATGTGYWFDYPDSYSPYGMIRKVSERRNMSCTPAGGGDCNSFHAAINQQASFTEGWMSREAVYDNPNADGYRYPHQYHALSDTPTFTQMTEDWAGRDWPAAALTKYSVSTIGSLRRSTIVRPNGVRVEQDTDDNPYSLYYGLLLEDRTYPDEFSDQVLRKSTVTWFRNQNPALNTDNSDLTYCAPRPAQTVVTDERGQSTTIVYSYGPYYNQLIDKSEYDYNGTTTRLHRVHTDFENSPAYRGAWDNRGTLWWPARSGGPSWSGPHIFSLTKATEVYGAHDSPRVARTEYDYDQYSLTATTATQHTAALVERGNLTSTTRYADAVGLNINTAFTETRTYDDTGNVVGMTTACCEKTTFEFDENTQYGWPKKITRGHATDTTKQNTTSAVYHLRTRLVLEATDANGGISYIGYQLHTLRPEWESTPAGSFTWHEYDDANLGVYDYAYEAGQGGGNFAASHEKYLDGLGRVTSEITYGKDYARDEVWTTYDNLGRRWQQSRPYRFGSASPYYTYEYDALDRTKKVTAPDGSVVERFYNEANYPSAATPNAPGQTVRAKDAWGRERWARFDAQNRLVEVVEPKPDGDGTVANNGLRTNYTYDTLGNLTLVEQGDQTRSFKYDALNRLTHQKLAERDATLNDQGSFVATWDQNQKKVTAANGAQWSDVFAYDKRSNLIWRVDARGVKTNFNWLNS